MVDKTYYYLYDINKRIIHVCSGGKTLCDLETIGLAELNLPVGVSVNTLSEDVYTLCNKCANYKEPKVKKAKFETKAEFTTPQKEE